MKVVADGDKSAEEDPPMEVLPEINEAWMLLQLSCELQQASEHVLKRWKDFSICDVSYGTGFLLQTHLCLKQLQRHMFFRFHSMTSQLFYTKVDLSSLQWIHSNTLSFYFNQIHGGI